MYKLRQPSGLLCFQLAFSFCGASPILPMVDLGYQIHQAISFNVSGGYYNFSNIRFGEPPIGNLRFSKPIPPRGSSSSVDNGGIGRICPTALPAWLDIGVPFLGAYIDGRPFNFTAANETFAVKKTTTVAPQDPRITEDCLFLDVMVPRKTFDSAKVNNSTGSPILVWIYGGGYCSGDKTSIGDPAGLIEASRMSGSEIIVVLLNYRLGAFGWLAGPTLQSNGTANAGFHDQRLALEWVQSNIHLFGGDPKRVTVMGESAGGGSILYQMTAYGASQGPAPFQQAIIQSPAWIQDIGVEQQENTLRQFLQSLNVSTIQEARQLPSNLLIEANSELIGKSPYGTFIIDPVVDGDFVPADPGKLLLEGAFDKTVKIMAGHNIAEGVLFTRPWVSDNSTFAGVVQSWLPTAKADTLAFINNNLYPTVFDGTYPYRDQLDRAILFVSEFVISCKSNWIERAFGNEAYGYIFGVPPGVHGQDTAYTFFNGPGMTDSFNTYNTTVARAMQQYFTSFVSTGAPRGGPAFPEFPTYGNGTVLNFTDAGIVQAQDPGANERCAYWQRAPYRNLTTYLAQPANISSSTWAGNFLGGLLTLLTGLVAL